MDFQRTDRKQFTLLYGAILGGLQVLWLLILYATDNLVGSSLPSLKWVILGVFLYLALKFYRTHFMGGYISYGQCIKQSARLSVLAGIFVGAFYFLLLKVFDPGVVQQMIVEVEEAYLAMGMPEGRVEELSEALKEGLTPWTMFFSNVFDVLLSGLIVGVIVGIFVKRKSDDAFQESMKDVQ